MTGNVQHHDTKSLPQELSGAVENITTSYHEAQFIEWTGHLLCVDDIKLYARDPRHQDLQQRHQMVIRTRGVWSDGTKEREDVLKTT